MTTIFVNQRLANDGLSTIGQFIPGIGHPYRMMLEPGPATPGYAHPRIPAGEYEIVLRAEGEKWGKFLQVFGELVRPGLPHIMVPNREWILVHPGNTFEDTEGCNLPGMSRLPPQLAPSHHWEVEQSREAFKDIYPLIRDACLNGGAAWRVSDEHPSFLNQAKAAA